MGILNKDLWPAFEPLKTRNIAVDYVTYGDLWLVQIVDGKTIDIG